MKNKSAQKVKLTSYDDLFGTNEPVTGEKITSVPISLFHTFKDHPFRVVDDAKMQETVESIKHYGVLVPGIVRPHPDNGYEVVAGHRRWRACELAGLEEMPVIIRELDDDAATVIMVDTNIQREDILPSEKAKAYRMKYEAMVKLMKQNCQLSNIEVTNGNIKSFENRGMDEGTSVRDGYVQPDNDVYRCQ